MHREAGVPALDDALHQLKQLAVHGQRDHLGTRHHDVGHGHAGTQSGGVHVEGLGGPRTEAEGCGIDDHGRVLGDLEARSPGQIPRRRGGARIDQRGQLRPALGGPIHNGDGCGAREGALHGDGTCCPAGTEDHHGGPRWVGDLAQRGEESLTVGVLACQVSIVIDHGVHRADDRRRCRELVEVLDDRDLVGKRTVEAAPSHRKCSPDRIRESVRLHVAVDVAEVEAGVAVRSLHQLHRRVVGSGGAERTGQLG